MRTVSFQGTQLTSGQRRRLDDQQRTRAFINPVLQQQVAETLVALDRRKETGAKPERQWFLEFEAKGTPCRAELFGF